MFRYSIQITLSGNTSLDVLLNGDDVTANVTNVNDTLTTDTLSIVKEAESSLSTTFSNGIGVTVTASFGMLSFVVQVPEELRNLTEGLLGDFNGDPGNDLVFRNGTTLFGNVTDRVIHKVGQSCEFFGCNNTCKHGLYNYHYRS